MDINKEKDYEFVQVGQDKSETPTSQTKIPYILFGIGVILLLALFLLTNFSDNGDLQNAILWISVFAIVASILYGVRNKLYTVIIAFLILLTVYFIVGWILGALGIVQYSYGVITFLIIGVWVFWLSRDSKISIDDIGKVVIFILATYIINQSGWLGQVNTMVTEYVWSGVLI